MERLELARLLGADKSAGAPRDVIIEESQPVRFMQAFGGAVAAGGTVFVADPSWGDVERAQFSDVVAQAPSANRKVKIEDRKSGIEHGWLCLPTGGSSGALRWARHDQDTLAAAVRGGCEHFAVSQVNAVGVLPLHHVSGLMAWMVLSSMYGAAVLSTGTSSKVNLPPCMSHWAPPRPWS